MGFRFRRSIAVFKGLRVNLSKSGISASIGVRGATINIKPGRQTRATVGIPGTGVSYTSTLGDSPASERHVAQDPQPLASQVPREIGVYSDRQVVLFALAVIIVIMAVWL